MVIDQAPKLMRRTKLPIVKAKIGPKISILIADEKVVEVIPVKKEVKADVSGLYIVGGPRYPRSSGNTPEEKGIFQTYFQQKVKTKWMPYPLFLSGRHPFFIFRHIYIPVSRPRGRSLLR